MTALNKQALRSKARSASAGEWIKESGDGWEAICSSDDQANGNFIIAHFEGPDAKENREFVQVANPAAVLTLLDELEAAKQDSARWFKAFEKAVSIGARYEERIEEITGKLEAAEKTSEARKQALIRSHKMFQRQRDRAVAAETRVAELEARAVVVKQFDDFQIVHYGGSEDYAKGYIDCQNNYNKALTAAGIGVKGE